MGESQHLNTGLSELTLGNQTTQDAGGKSLPPGLSSRVSLRDQPRAEERLSNPLGDTEVIPLYREKWGPWGNLAPHSKD